MKCELVHSQNMFESRKQKINIKYLQKDKKNDIRKKIFDNFGFIGYNAISNTQKSDVVRYIKFIPQLLKLEYW